MKRSQSSPSRRKSPARNKSPARAKSPARTKSPARAKSPTRQKSPARTKSPGRTKSPARKPATPKSTKNSSVALRQLTPESISILTSSVEREIKEKTPDIIERIAELRNSRSRERSRTVEEIRVSQTRLLSSFAEEKENSDSSGATLRRSARVKSTYQIDGLKKSVDDQVDKIIKSNHISEYIPPKENREFGNWIGTLLLTFIIPLFVVALQLSCTSKDKCKPLEYTISYNWKYYLDPLAAACVTGFVTWQFLLSSIPLSKKIDGFAPRHDVLQYRCSGIVNALLTLSAIGALHYFKYSVTSILSKTIALLVSSIIVGFVLSLALFIKGGRPSAVQNPHANTGNKIYDFFIGREVSPRFGVLDIKLTLARTAVIGALIYDAAFVLRAIENKPFVNYPPTLLVVTGLQIFTLLDFLLFEEVFLSSFYIQHEGAGYMLVTGTLVFPFFITFIPKYIYAQSVDLNVYLLAALTVLYILAYAIYRVSSNQKNNFRRNPLSPSVAHLEAIPAVAGKKILCGGCWGIVRHPNYLGLILMYWLLSISTGVQHWSPYTVALATTAILCQRAIRDNARCRSYYGSSWERYTQKVKNYLLPRIF